MRFCLDGDAAKRIISPYEARYILIVLSGYIFIPKERAKRADRQNWGNACSAI